jgi:hypothetical protein
MTSSKQTNFVIQYIIITPKDTFCDSESSFLKFLTVDSSFTIVPDDNIISFVTGKNKSVNVRYELLSGLVPSQDERYFNLTLKLEDNRQINEFNDLIERFESNVVKIHNDVSINMLWNDVARHYAITGYSIINEVENLLRRLIANFMLTNVGYNYPKYHIPAEVANRDSNLKTNYSDYLHKTYFSDLKTILFQGQREYDFRNIGDIQKFVEKCISDGKDQIPIESLKGVLSSSLWAKYFSKNTSYKQTNLESDLENLGDLRNDIAHNRHISRETLGKIEAISKRITTALELEIKDLPNKKLSGTEQELQVATENNRILNLSPSTKAHLVELAVYDWYIRVFSTENVKRFKEGPDLYGLDMLVRKNNGESIGVEVKLFSLSKFNQLRRTMYNDYFWQKYMPANAPNVTAFHLVIVLDDYIGEYDVSFLIDLKNHLKIHYSRLSVLVGYIANDKFELLTKEVIF